MVEEVVLPDDGDTCISNPAQKTSSAWDNPCSVELSHDDMKCLEPESLLSSNILNFYIMYLLGTTQSTSRLRDKCHIFNTYFFTKLEALTSKVDQAPYFLKMRRWWKGVDIFQKAYLLFPVHAEFLKQEWSYLNEPGSLEGFHLHGSVRRNLPRNICKKAIEVPQQENDYDCGLFVLYYMKRFIEEAPERLHEKDLSKKKPSGREDGAEGGAVDDIYLREQPSYVLLERSRRMQRVLDMGIITARLPDGGAKYRLLLDNILREIDRRNAEAPAVVTISSSSFSLL
ncbi:hypothetical protein GUJ93_ZPchr0006g40858 [Zizania palustris]|uniref:Ubiquitin-like protease family profile domain-containing protein n=1 Tax=Zizania palustris TaxID=103762 RepID=A0A8J5W3G7_ZIZPA|nr:hypothetical protein GUJ93_ZPchr0006g40858 [Zizania palustris]